MGAATDRKRFDDEYASWKAKANGREIAVDDIMKKEKLALTKKIQRAEQVAERAERASRRKSAPRKVIGKTSASTRSKVPLMQRCIPKAADKHAAGDAEIDIDKQQRHARKRKRRSATENLADGTAQEAAD